MSRCFNSSALGAADPAGQPLQYYNQPQQWPNQDPGPDADPLDGADPPGDQDDDLEADDDLPVDLPETKGFEVPQALKAERRKTNQLEHDQVREVWEGIGLASWLMRPLVPNPAGLSSRHSSSGNGG